MKTPDFLVNWLKSLTPQQADQLWLYFDGCSNEHLIEICSEVALQDPVIRKNQRSELKS